MANLTGNKGMQKVAGMTDTFGQMQQMREAQMVNDASKTAAQGAADNLAKQVPVTTVTKIDDMLSGIYPNGADPKIRDFYINLLGKNGQ